MNLIGISGYIGSGKDTVGEMIQYIMWASIAHLLPGEKTASFDKWLTYKPYSGWEVKKFAAKLKQIASLLTGIPAEKFEDQEFKKTILPKEWDYSRALPRVDMFQENKYWEDVSMTVREFLQKLGTEGIREGVHTNAWVNALFADYKSFLGGSKEYLPYSNGYIHKENYSKYGFREEDFIKEKTPDKFITRWPEWIITDTRFPNEAQAIKDRGGIVVRVNRHKVKPDSQEKVILHPSETSLDIWKFDHVINNDGTKEELLEKVREMLVKYNII